jgi:hypothetical protein
VIGLDAVSWPCRAMSGMIDALRRLSRNRQSSAAGFSSVIVEIFGVPATCSAAASGTRVGCQPQPKVDQVSPRRQRIRFPYLLDRPIIESGQPGVPRMDFKFSPAVASPDWLHGAPSAFRPLYGICDPIAVWNGRRGRRWRPCPPNRERAREAACLASVGWDRRGQAPSSPRGHRRRRSMTAVSSDRQRRTRARTGHSDCPLAGGAWRTDLADVRQR